MLRVAAFVTIGAAGLAALLSGVLVSGASEASLPQATNLSGREVPREGCLFVNGWNVCSYGEAALKDHYLRYQDLLGDPVSAFDSRCQTFRFGRLCYSAGNPPEWRVEFANLGLQDLQARGVSPQPGAEPHPAVRDWLISQLEVGLDTTRIVGRTVSQPVCDKTSGRCRQWTDKQLFLFPTDASAGHEVQRAPLGAWSLRPQPIDQPAESRVIAPVPLAAGVVLILVGLAGLMLSGRSAGGRGPVTV